MQYTGNRKSLVAGSTTAEPPEAEKGSVCGTVLYTGRTALTDERCRGRRCAPYAPPASPASPASSPAGNRSHLHERLVEPKLRTPSFVPRYTERSGRRPANRTPRVVPPRPQWPRPAPSGPLQLITGFMGESSDSSNVVDGCSRNDGGSSARADDCRYTGKGSVDRIEPRPTAPPDNRSGTPNKTANVNTSDE